MASTDEVFAKINLIQTIIDNFPMSLLELLGGKVYTSIFDFIVDVLAACGVDIQEIFQWLISKIYALADLPENWLEDVENLARQGAFDINGQSGFIAGLEESLKYILMALLSGTFSCSVIPTLPNKLMDWPNPDTFKNPNKDVDAFKHLAPWQNKNINIILPSNEDTVPPVIEKRNGGWYISYDEGKNWDYINEQGFDPIIGRKKDKNWYITYDNGRNWILLDKVKTKSEIENTQGSEGSQDPQGPQGGEGSQDPEGGEGSQDPEGGEGSQDPEGGEGSQDPEGGEGSQDPEGGEGSQDPQGPQGTESEGEIYVVYNCSSLAIRKGPGTKYDAWGALSSGAEVTVISTEQYWYKIKYEKGDAYLGSKYLTKKDNTTDTGEKVFKFKVKSGGLNIRKLPNNDNDTAILYSMTTGDIFEVYYYTSDEKKWTKATFTIKGKKYEGYVNVNYATQLTEGDIPVINENTQGPQGGEDSQDPQGPQGGEGSGDVETPDTPQGNSGKTEMNVNIESRYPKKITIPTSMFDLFDLLKIIPTSDEGRLFYNVGHSKFYKFETDGTYKEYASVDEMGCKHKEVKQLFAIPTSPYAEYSGTPPTYISIYEGLLPNELYRANDMNAFIWYVLRRGTLVPQIEYNHMMWDNRIRLNKNEEKKMRKNRRKAKNSPQNTEEENVVRDIEPKDGYIVYNSEGSVPLHHQASDSPATILLNIPSSTKNSYSKVKFYYIESLNWAKVSYTMPALTMNNLNTPPMSFTGYVSTDYLLKEEDFYTGETIEYLAVEAVNVYKGDDKETIIHTFNANDTIDVIKLPSDEEMANKGMLWAEIRYNNLGNHFVDMTKIKPANVALEEDDNTTTDKIEGTIYEVANCYYLNVRKNPSSDNKTSLILKVLTGPLGKKTPDRVEVIEEPKEGSDWLKIKYKDGEAYIHKYYAKKITDGSDINGNNDSVEGVYLVNNCYYLNVRKNPSSNNKTSLILKVLTGPLAGTPDEVEVISIEGNWAKIKVKSDWKLVYGDKSTIAYVHKNYIIKKEAEKEEEDEGGEEGGGGEGTPPSDTNINPGATSGDSKTNKATEKMLTTVGDPRINPSDWNKWYASKKTRDSEFDTNMYSGAVQPILQLEPAMLNVEGVEGVNFIFPSQVYYKPRLRKYNKKEKEFNVATIHPGMVFNATIYKFNWDYLKSIQILNPKMMIVLMVQHLLQFTIDQASSINVNFMKEVVREKVSTAVKKVIEAGDSEVEDCYMTFSNDEVNSLLENTLMSKYSSTKYNGETTKGKQHDVKGYLDTLQSINKSTASGTTTKITKLVNEVAVDPGTEGSIDYGVQIGYDNNILQRLIEAVTMPIIMSLFTPQVILLLMINQEVTGLLDLKEITNINLDTIVKLILNKIFSILKTIILYVKDLIVNALLELFFEKIVPLIAKAKLIILMEKIEYWEKLLREILSMLPRFDFSKYKIKSSIEMVDYADITTTQTIPENNSGC
jgi:hypothetical protein